MNKDDYFTTVYLPAMQKLAATLISLKLQTGIGANKNADLIIELLDEFNQTSVPLAERYENAQHVLKKWMSMEKAHEEVIRR